MTALQPIREVVPSGGPRLERVVGRARVAVRADAGRTRLNVLYQSGAAKIRLPRVAAGAPFEAVLLNTAGGLTGGDRLSFEVSAGEGASAVATTQAAERIYRRSDGVAEVDTVLSVEPGARLDWLPQETILFDRSALARRLSADVAPDATLLAVESIVLGRSAMGERVREASFSDAWRIRRGGKLVFADTARVNGDVENAMAGPATGNGSAAFATLVLVAPAAGERLDEVRAVLVDAAVEGGASAWNGLLVARLIAPDGYGLRTALIRLIEALRRCPMPRVWFC